MEKLQAIKTICTVIELLPPSKNEVGTCTCTNPKIGRIQILFLVPSNKRLIDPKHVFLHFQIVEVLKFIAKQEGIDLPHELAERFAQNSKNNLHLAIRSFEATWKKG